MVYSEDISFTRHTTVLARFVIRIRSDCRDFRSTTPGFVHPPGVTQGSSEFVYRSYIPAHAQDPWELGREWPGVRDRGYLGESPPSEDATVRSARHQSATQASPGSLWRSLPSILSREDDCPWESASPGPPAFPTSYPALPPINTVPGRMTGCGNPLPPRPWAAWPTLPFPHAYCTNVDRCV